MKLAHLADLHLGFRQYARMTPRGLNQREADVADAARRAVDDVIAQRPDLIVVAGDVFHSVRPTNTAIVFAFRELHRLRTAVPDAPIVLLAGQHDTPRSIETGSILRLFEALGVTVVDDAPRRLEFPELDTSVLAVPHQALRRGERPELRPAGRARNQILLLHGDEQSLTADPGVVEYGGAVFDIDEIAPEQWTYVALGHYHLCHQVRPNAWYAGSLEFTSHNPWGELRRADQDRGPAKGYLLVELPRGTPELRVVGPIREHLDLKAIEGVGLDARALDALIRERVEHAASPIDDRVVRLVLWNVPRHVARDLDHQAIREYKARALHFHVDVRRPPPARLTAGQPASRRLTLPELVREYLQRRPLDADLDRERFVQVGIAYLEEAMGAEDERA